MDSEYIQPQQISPDINPNDENAMRRVVDLGKSNMKKLYELEERIEKLERIVFK